MRITLIQPRIPLRGDTGRLHIVDLDQGVAGLDAYGWLLPESEGEAR